MFFLLIVVVWIVWYWKFQYKKKSVEGSRILITGGASGLGRLTAVRFAKLGAKIVLWDINSDGLIETEKLVKEAVPDAKVSKYTCNLMQRQEIYDVARKVKEQDGPIDILVNNAGYVSGKSILDIDDEQILTTMNVNVISHFWTIRAFLPDMIERKSGHIVSIASMAGHSATPNLTDYSASKFAAVGLNESLRVELKKKGHKNIFTTCICPFFINTGMFDGVKTKWGFLLPILDQDYAADQIVDATLKNKEMLMLPFSMNFLPLVRILPVAFQDIVFNFLGVHDSMEEFVGRAKNE